MLAITLEFALHHVVPAHGARASLVIGLCLVWAIGDEIHQHFTPHRDANFSDVALDLIGALMGVALALGLALAERRRRDRARNGHPRGFR